MTCGTNRKGETMTRKDYVLIAKAIKEAYEGAFNAEIQIGVKRTASILAQSIQNENPKFDRAVFFEACGL